MGEQAPKITGTQLSIFCSFQMLFTNSAYFYPRYTMLLFVAYHIYYFTVPFGFFRLALIPYFLLMVHCIIFTLLVLEIPAAKRGVISRECPREVYSQLSWSQWSAQLPVLWTLFLPLNSRYIPMHDRDYDDDDTIRLN